MTFEDELGPVDYVVIEFPGTQLRAELAPELLRLMENGLIHLIDLVVVRKDADGTVTAIEVAEADEGSVGLLATAVPDVPGLLSEEDVAAAGEALEPDTSALLIVWENLWAAPFAAATRRLGGEVVASGRIPVADLLATIEAGDAGDD